MFSIALFSVQSLYDRSDLIADCRAQHAVSRVKPLGCDHPAGDVIGAQSLAC
jgi:hypothetical protein